MTTTTRPDRYQRDLFEQAAARDKTLDALARTRATLIAVATTHALRIARSAGTVTSPQVLASMRADGWEDLLGEVDPRFMGAVLLPSKGWERAGWERSGSKGRPVAVWRRAGREGRA